MNELQNLLSRMSNFVRDPDWNRLCKEQNNDYDALRALYDLRFFKRADRIPTELFKEVYLSRYGAIGIKGNILWHSLLGEFYKCAIYAAHHMDLQLPMTLNGDRDIPLDYIILRGHVPAFRAFVGLGARTKSGNYIQLMTEYGYGYDRLAKVLTEEEVIEARCYY